MLAFQWNALRRGDRVLVHDVADAHLGLRSGVVSLVDVGPAGHDVGIRFTSGTTSVVRPGRFAVHFDPIGASDECWRCADTQR